MMGYPVGETVGRRPLKMDATYKLLLTVIIVIVIIAATVIVQQAFMQRTKVFYAMKVFCLPVESIVDDLRIQMGCECSGCGRRRRIPR